MNPPTTTSRRTCASHAGRDGAALDPDPPGHQDHPTRVSEFEPNYAMSGGPLIALGADEIFMSEHAVLGPIDPQINRLLAASMRVLLGGFTDRPRNPAQRPELRGSLPEPLPELPR